MRWSGISEQLDRDQFARILRPQSGFQHAVDYPRPIHVGDGHKELDTGLEQDERFTEERVT